MSADEEISNELLALYDNSDKPRKKRRQSGNERNGSSKRRRPNDTTDDDLESEEGGGPVDPYPLEGKYIDEDDRERLLDMNELEREEILAQRLEEQQHYLDSIKLERMHKIATGRATSDDDEAVSKAAKRKHTAPGTSRVKAKMLDELKAKRAKARATKREETRRAMSSSSGSGSDMEESDEEEEGQVSRWDEDENKKGETPTKAADDHIDKQDLEKIRLTRDLIEKWCHAPFFGEMVTGLWVRFLVGPGEDQQPVYRVCEVTGLTAESPVSYKIQTAIFNQQAELKHGKSVKAFNLDRVSNGAFTDREFDRLVVQHGQDKIPLPTKRFIEKKTAELAKYQAHVPTESEITHMISRKNRLSGKGNANQQYAEKSRLHQERALAAARRDHLEVARLDALINSQARISTPEPNGVMDSLMKVNERNRKANLERVRKAEAAEAEERRRQSGLRPGITRKLHSTSTGNTPVLGPQDTSKDSIQPLTLDGGGLLTPGANTPSGGMSPNPRRVAPRLESKLATSIDLDLGDF